ncbi:Alpha/Beta hydrolase protein [Stachybotrys elegans]|uniref:Alpha/Beta hydrolase protein n=1 Tax=Stachybotrys elegans TaxID=80388 RepID=A0A8K0SH82_9HYPO|nr:Alpha/Beta hydrolase protein [Stachybotrys elegans]
MSNAEPSRCSWLMGSKAFDKRMPHHDGIKYLWELSWKAACAKSVYPFHEGRLEDFEPIFLHLIDHNIDDATSTEYTNAFFKAAETLEYRGDEFKSAGDTSKASELYLRASTIYRIARFPFISGFPTATCATKWRAWEAQKKVYLKATALWESTIKEILVQHSHRKGQDRDEIPIFVRFPSKVDKAQKCPVVILLTGLDGYRPDFTAQFQAFHARGWATIAVEIPGTADSPADPSDPDSADRTWTSLLDWMTQDGSFDMNNVVAWGLSTGGYYGARIAHTHSTQLRGCIAQGMGCHDFFDAEWLSKIEDHEYPFELLPHLAKKHGYDSVDEYKKHAKHKFSLVESGILNKPSTRLLLLNGLQDGLMPIEDSMLLFNYGNPKEARFFPGTQHMGGHLAVPAAYAWIERVMVEKINT